MKNENEKSCSIHECPFANTSATKCWKCDRRRIVRWSWQGALFITTALGVMLSWSILRCYPWSLYGSAEPRTNSVSEPFIFLWISLGMFAVSFVILIITVYKAKSEYLTDGKRRAPQSLCQNPRCHYDLNKASCPDCGRIMSPFSHVWLWTLVAVNTPLAIAGSCIQASYQRDATAAIIGYLTFGFGAAVLVWLVIDYSRRSR